MRTASWPLSATRGTPRHTRAWGAAPRRAAPAHRRSFAYKALGKLEQAKEAYEKVRRRRPHPHSHPHPQSLLLAPDNAGSQAALDEVKAQLAQQQQPRAAPANPLGGLDLGALLSNPNIMQMASGLMRNPAMQNMMAGMMGGVRVLRCRIDSRRCSRAARQTSAACSRRCACAAARRGLTRGRTGQLGQNPGLAAQMAQAMGQTAPGAPRSALPRR